MIRRAMPWLALACLVVGCALPQTRLQSEDEAEPEVKYDVKTIGDVTEVANADPIPVSGVGLVEGLEGTGGGAPPGDFRAMLERQLQKDRERNIKELLASKETSLVLVTALIPPGARKGDLLDVEVTLPGNSKTTSLRGGRLRACDLFNYELARNLSGHYAQSDKAIMGHPLARAEGSLLVGFGDGDDAMKQKQGRIWGGARCNIDRPFYLMLKSDQQFARVASAVADRINDTFQGSFRGSGNEMAKAKDKSLIFLNVPPQYKHNLARYLRVIRLIPLREVPEQVRQVKNEDGSVTSVKHTYRACLEEDLLNPARAVTAALRLEALGPGSVPALKRGLTHEHPLVRFCCAESLAYLGSPSCGDVLAEMVAEHPMLRAFSLTALASLDEAVSHVKLRELLRSPKPETRYGAFRGLRALDERDPMVAGELLNDSFWLHCVAPASASMIHISTSRRPEVVLFGDEPTLKAPLSLQAGEFNVTAEAGDEQCTILHFSPRRGTSRRKQCSLKLEDLLRTVAAMGGQYPEVVELLRQANTTKCLSCELMVDQLPEAISVQDLARAGRGNSEDLLMDQEIMIAKPDFGATPTLYQKDSARRPRSMREADETAALRDRKPHGVE